jgi:hypothetical protein
MGAATAWTTECTSENGSSATANAERFRCLDVLACASGKITNRIAITAQTVTPLPEVNMLDPKERMAWK